MLLTVRFQASGSVEDYDEEKKNAILRVLLVAAEVSIFTPGSVTVTPASVIIEASWAVPSPTAAESALSLLRWNAGSAFKLTQLFERAGIEGVTVETAPFFNSAPFVGGPPPPALAEIVAKQEVNDDAARNDVSTVLAVFLPLIFLACLVSIGLLVRHNKHAGSAFSDPLPQVGRSIATHEGKVDVEAVAVTSSASSADPAMTIDHVKV